MDASVFVRFQSMKDLRERKIQIISSVLNCPVSLKQVFISELTHTIRAKSNRLTLQTRQGKWMQRNELYNLQILL